MDIPVSIVSSRDEVRFACITPTGNCFMTPTAILSASSHSKDIKVNHKICRVGKPTCPGSEQVKCLETLYSSPRLHPTGTARQLFS